MRLKAIHTLQLLLCAGPCRLALIVAYRLTTTLAGVALFLGHLAHGFHRVAVLFRVFTVALRDEPSNLRRISPLLARSVRSSACGRCGAVCMGGVTLGTLVSYPLHVGC